MGWPEFGDERDVTPRLDSDRADALKEKLKEEGRWPPIPIKDREKAITNMVRHAELVERLKSLRNGE